MRNWVVCSFASILLCSPLLADQYATDEATDKVTIGEVTPAFVLPPSEPTTRGGVLIYTNSFNPADPYMITRPGGHCNTNGDATDLQSALSLNVFGFGCQISANNTVADDFVLSSPVMVQQIVFYAYQTGATSPTINQVQYAIVNTNPLGQVPPTLINVTPTSVVMQNVYKKLDTDAPTAGCTRIIQKVTVTVDPPLTLNPGQYWLIWRIGGTGSSGPWQPPVVNPGQINMPNSNAMQSTSGGAFAYLVDSGNNSQQDLIFELYGAILGAPGACCFPDGSCQFLGGADCAAAGGQYQGEGIPCDPNPCPQPGACCSPYGVCTPNVLPAACEAGGGTYMGPGSTCDPNPCYQPEQRCCFPDGSCQILTYAECVAQGGVPGPLGSTCFETGYFFEVCTNQFEDISGTGTHVTQAECDDCGTAIPLPFTFYFWGQAKTSVGVSSNGYLTFSTVYTDYTPDPIPNPATPNDLIAVFWRDLNATVPPAGGVQYEYRTDPSRFIVQWTHVPNYGSTTDFNTFQAILYEGSNAIEFRYAAELMGTGYQAGVEDATGTHGVSVTGLVAPGACIRLYPGDVPACPQPGACCFLDGSCVEMFQADCDAAFGAWRGPNTVCDPNPCPPPCVECPPEGIDEGEPLCGPGYVDNYNGGCNSTPYVFQPINFGDIICGESGTFMVGSTQTRDTDWFEVVLTEPKRIQFTVTATFALQIFVIDGAAGCANPQIIGQATASACQPATITTGCLNPGTYWLWVGPSVFTGIPCGAPYVAQALALDCYGACCLPNRECVILLPDECAAQNGRFLGPNTNCGLDWNYVPSTCTNPFMDISSTGTFVNLTDDSGVRVPIGFTFVFYGVPWTDVGLCSNGYLTFSTVYTDYTEDPIPNTNTPNDLIAVLWDDLNPGAVTTEWIGYQTFGTAPNRYFVAEWKDVPQFGGSDQNTFEVILYEGSNDLEFRYGNFAVAAGDFQAGVENSTGTLGTSITAMVTPGACVYLTAVPPSNPCACTELRGDANCDGVVNAFDIDAFVLALTDPGQWQQLYSCDIYCVADCNCDLQINSFDIDQFVACLTQGGCQPCP